MHSKHRNFAILVFLFSFILCWIVGAKITEPSASGLLTVFAIITGFYITSVTIIIGSASVTRLYREVDQKIPGQTKLQTYNKYFLNCFYWSILSILLMVLFLSKPQQWTGAEINLIYLESIPNIETFLHSLLFSISFVNIYWSIVMFQTLMAIMLYEGRDKNHTDT